MKKTISVLLSLLMLIFCFNLSLSAENSNIIEGYCGEEGRNLTWILDKTTGELTISGTGKMKDFTTFEATPWYVYDLSNIKSLIINEGVTYIGTSAFAVCHNLTRIEIPSSITKIPESSFAMCTSLDSIHIKDMSAWCNIDFEGTILYNFVKLFLNNVLVTDLEIPNDVSIIKRNAFAYYNSLESVTLSSSVTTVEDYAFYECSNLSNVNFGNGVKSIGSAAFAFCNSLRSITIPDNIVSIDTMAFWDCINLNSITIGNGIKSIGSDAFKYCENLENVYLTDISSWCNIAFSGETSNPMYYAENLYINNTLATEITIPNEVTTINDYAFANHSKLKDIIMHDNITFIGNNAFLNCNNLVYSKYDNAYYLGNTTNPYICLMYVSDTSIESININSSTKLISTLAFDNCQNLTSVDIPNGVRVIGNQAFVNCKNLISINIPSSLEIIDAGAFGFCSNLSSIVIPDGVISIGKQAFANCRKLDNVVIGSNVKDVGDNAFVECDSLQTIYVKSTYVSEMMTDMYSPEYMLTNSKTLLFKNNIENIPEYVKNNYEYKGTSYENDLEYVVYSKVDYPIKDTSNKVNNETNGNDTFNDNDSNSKNNNTDETKNSSKSSNNVIETEKNKNSTDYKTNTNGCDSFIGNRTITLLLVPCLATVFIAKKKKKD